MEKMIEDHVDFRPIVAITIREDTKYFWFQYLHPRMDPQSVFPMEFAKILDLLVGRKTLPRNTLVEFKVTNDGYVFEPISVKEETKVYCGEDRTMEYFQNAMQAFPNDIYYERLKVGGLVSEKNGCVPTVQGETCPPHTFTYFLLLTPLGYSLENFRYPLQVDKDLVESVLKKRPIEEGDEVPIRLPKGLLFAEPVKSIPEHADELSKIT